MRSDDAGPRSALLAKILTLLDWTYDKAVGGVPGFERAEDLAVNYRVRCKSPDEAIDKLLRWQTGNAGIAGFITNSGGLLTLPIAIPANVASVLLIQVRTIAAIAYLRGYDIRSDQVKTLVFACLAGSAAMDVLKDTGIQLGARISMRVIARLPYSVLKTINRAVGFRLLTKAGTRGVINLSRLIPVLGGLIGGGIDAAATQVIGRTAKRVFVANGGFDPSTAPKHSSPSLFTSASQVTADQ